MYFVSRWGEDAGRKHGPYTTFNTHTGWKLVEGAYISGQRDGLWTLWGTNGALMKQATMNVGTFVRRIGQPPWLGGATDQMPWDSPHTSLRYKREQRAEGKP